MSFGDARSGAHACLVNLRHAPLLGLGLVILACGSGGDADGDDGPIRAAQLDGFSCARVGATARLKLGVSVGANVAPSFRVLSVGCAPSCSAVLGEGDVVAIHSNLEGAATVQAVVVIDEGTPPARTVTAARVVRFVGSGVCDADGGVHEEKREPGLRVTLKYHH